MVVGGCRRDLLGVYAECTGVRIATGKQIGSGVSSVARWMRSTGGREVAIMGIAFHFLDKMSGIAARCIESVL
jgi:hypothetical protein